MHTIMSHPGDKRPIKILHMNKEKKLFWKEKSHKKYQAAKAFPLPTSSLGMETGIPPREDSFQPLSHSLSLSSIQPVEGGNHDGYSYKLSLLAPAC